MTLSKPLTLPYTFAVGAWYISYGIQLVLIPWVLAVVLNTGAHGLAIGVIALAAPVTLLALFGGAISDRFSAHNVATLAYFSGALLCLIASVLIYWKGASFLGIISYALAIGTVEAFLAPSRDKLLNTAFIGKIQNGVMIATGVQYGMQMIGILLGGSVDYIGLQELLTVQMLVLFMGGLFCLYISPNLEEKKVYTDKKNTSEESIFRMISISIRIILSNRKLRSACGLAFILGFCFAATYMIYLPLMVKNRFGADSQLLAMANFANLSGVAIGISCRLFLKEVKNPILTAAVTFCFGGLFLAMLGIQQTLVTVLFLAAGWGLCGGQVIALSRTIIHIESLENNRGRCLAFFWISILIGELLGAPVVAGLINRLGDTAVYILGCVAIMVGIYIYSNERKRSVSE